VLDFVVLLVRGLVGLLGLRVAAGDFRLVAFRHRVAPEQVTTPVARTATVQGGALWKDVYREAALFGLVPMGGDCDMVGVGGSTLGGGWGYLSRSAGLAIQHTDGSVT